MEQEISKISKEDFLRALELAEHNNNANTPDHLTPISGQIFFGSSFKALQSTMDQQVNGSIKSQPNTPLSPRLRTQTTTSSNGDLYLDASLVFENPCFNSCIEPTSDSKSKFALRPQTRSPNKVFDVPVIAPKRRSSFFITDNLCSADRIAMTQNKKNMLKENKMLKQEENQIEHIMAAYSTQCLQPYNGINLSERSETEVPNFSNHNDFNYFNGALKDEIKEVRSTDFQPPYSNLDKEKSINISSMKFGWFEGVFIRTSVNLLGVMLFIRMGWMSAQCGIIIALLQILIATIITSLTTLSMNALCTNGDIGAGGIYSMISRSLGPEAGANIGIIFAFTNAAFVGLNLIGAADAVIQIFEHFSIHIFTNPLNDIRLIGFLFLIIVALIPIVSLELEAKTQTFFFVVILICIFDYLIGALTPPNEEQVRRGFHGFHLYVAKSNLYPKFVNSEKKFSVFGVFFPSVTPIFTGACMSGDLRNPAEAIPKGTFLSIAFTSLTYAVFVVLTGCTIVSYSLEDGSSPSGSFLINSAEYCPPSRCKYGLINDYNTLSLSSGMAHFGFYVIEPFIYTGILAATLSSALGCYMAAPRIFQSFAEDKIFPKFKWFDISWFAKGYGPGNDPRRGYLLTAIIAAIFTLIGNLNRIAPYISNFYLASFFIVNVTCFHAAWVRVPSFRPSFKYFNKWVSLLTGIICFILMFLLDYVSAVFSVVLMSIIFYFIKKKSPKVNWGTTSEAQLFNLAHSSALKWDLTSDHVKNYRPRIVCLTGNPSARTALLDMAFAITRDYGLLFALHLRNEHITADQRAKAENSQKMWLYNRKIRAFYALAEAQSLSEGVKQIVPIMGLGKLKPNIVMLGYKSNWQTCFESDLKDYFSAVMSVLDQRSTLIILRIQEGFDFSEFLQVSEQFGEDKPNKSFLKTMNRDFQHNLTTSMIEESANEHTTKSYKDIFKNTLSMLSSKESNNNKNGAGFYRSGLSQSNAQSSASLHLKIHRNNILVRIEEKVTNEIPKVIFRSMNQFQVTQKSGTIDIWWLYDTGGICILVAFILRNNQLWRNSKIRVFSVIQNAIDIESMKQSLIELLQKFRIPFSDVQVLSDQVPPNDETKLQFRDVINEWIGDEEIEKHYDTKDKIRMRITKSELINHRELTNRHIRLRELLLEYSYDATLIVMSLPRPGFDSSVPLYMSWLEMLTQGMPPFLLVRGSQSVLTFYI